VSAVLDHDVLLEFDTIAVVPLINLKWTDSSLPRLSRILLSRKVIVESDEERLLDYQDQLLNIAQ
jgi:hypothetical protein